VEKDEKHEETRNHGNSLLVDVSAASAVPVDSLIATISPSLVLPRDGRKISVRSRVSRGRRTSCQGVFYCPCFDPVVFLGVERTVKMEGERKKKERIHMQTFFAPYTVTIADINYGKHLGNDRPLVIFQDARIRFFKSLGLSEGDIGNGRSIVVVESGCRYMRQVFLHEELQVAVTIGELQGKRCRLNTVSSVLGMIRLC
jgi:hypothetical protein